MDSYAGLVEAYVDQLLAASTPETPAWNIENIRLGKKPGWNYIDGLMLKAILDLYRLLGTDSYRDFACSFMDYYVKDDGSLLGCDPADHNIDNVNGGKVLFTLLDLTGLPKYRLALDWLRAQLLNHPRTAAGNFWHKGIYPHQVWLDGLYMAQPFLVEYSTRFESGSSYADVFGQFDTVFRLMRDPKTGLLYHGYDESRSMFWSDPKTGLSASFWLRSLGWIVMAMVDVLELADPLFTQGRHRRLAQHLHALVDALLQFQDGSSGMWHQLVNRPELDGNYLETSGSAILSYSLQKAARLGFLPDPYGEAGVRAYRGICRRYLDEQDGKLRLGGICLVAGLGGKARRDGSASYYLSEPVVQNDAKGVGPFLLAHTEMLRRRGA